MNANSEKPDAKEGLANFWQLVILALSGYVLLALAAEWLFKPQEQVLILLRWTDAAICLVFIADFFFRLHRAPDKLAFLKWGWIDLAASIPFLPLARWGRLVRVARILVLLRSVRSAKAFLDVIFQSRIKGTFLSVVLATVVMVMVSSVAILICETSPGANIRTAGDALWWSFSTVTAVGYGDFYPVTLEGRLIAAVLMTAGVALFTTLTAMIVSHFLSAGRAREGEDPSREILEELRRLRRELERRNGNGNGG
ncbi:MAG: ion transporter [Kiritimatiellia bacterium]